MNIGRKYNIIIVASIAGVLLALTFFPSCYYDKEDKLYEKYLASLQCDSVTITYAKTIEPIILSECATSGCHVSGGTAPGIFTTYDGVKAKVDNGSMLNRTITLKNMPPNTLLTDCQLLQVRKWMEAGAPNN